MLVPGQPYGESLSDNVWFRHYATKREGSLYVLDMKDYTHISNTATITHQRDYFDVRALDYIDVIPEIIRLAKLEKTKNKTLFVQTYAIGNTPFSGAVTEQGSG
ncbi:hypothetical protein D3C75_490650 [compost metagenome]